MDEVICAIPAGAADDDLAVEAARYGPVFRGHEHDVLARYYWAALSRNAEVIVRVTGDCPLISSQVCGAVLAELKVTGADYASNVEPRSVPRGLDCEAFKMGILRRAYREAILDEREHVTTWMRRADIRRVTVDNFSIDTENDYVRACAAFGHEPSFDLQSAGSLQDTVRSVG